MFLEKAKYKNFVDKKIQGVDHLDMVHILKPHIIRVGIAALLYGAVLGILGTWLYFEYIYDIGATYASLGLLGLPVAILILWFLDKFLSKKALFKDKYSLLTLIDCAVCVPLYYLLTILVLFVGMSIASL